MPLKFQERSDYYLLLLVCGDVSLNPGPVRNPCGICRRPVAETIGQHSVVHVISGIILSVRISPRVNTQSFVAMINRGFAETVWISMSLIHSLNAQMNRLSLKKV